MGNDWAAVDDLMRELGSVRQAASLLASENVAGAALDRAIAEAAEAVNQTIDAPRNPAKLMAARDAIGVAEEVILALDREIGRSLRVRVRAQALCDRAAYLIDQATQARQIRFGKTKRPRDHGRIADALKPLALSGYTMTVESNSESGAGEEWQIRIEKKGRVLAFRLPLDATSTDWDAAVRKTLPR
jgi:hypothetical protein